PSRERVKKLDVDVEVWSFKKSLSKVLLWEVGRDRVHFLDDIIDDIRLTDDKSEN
ncbi:unnamed protein product, partial [marine sediment metagenome]